MKETIMEFRRVFDTIPEKFDRYRPRYCKEAFDEIFRLSNLGEESGILEIGPGTGQASEPFLDAGCDYSAIELGEHLCDVMKRKFGERENFHIVCGDFITYDFWERQFDLILSAAAIQWIPEEIAFSKCFRLLKPGGMLAMLTIHGDYKTPNPPLYEEIQKVYAEHFFPTEKYSPGFRYENCEKYGFRDFETRRFSSRRVMNTEEYVEYCGTHCDHIVLPLDHKAAFFAGLRDCVDKGGGKVVFDDTIILRTARKPAGDKG